MTSGKHLKMAGNAYFAQKGWILHFVSHNKLPAHKKTKTKF